MEITSYLLGKKAGGGGDTPTGTINITENGTTNVSSYATANVNVQPKLEEKSITITENGTTTLTPTTGKDGISSVSITTNVSGGGNYNVEVDTSLPYDGAYGGGIRSLIKSVNNIDTSNLRSTAYMFSTCTNLKSIPLLNTSNSTNMLYMFQRCFELKDVPVLNTSKVTNMNNMFDECRVLTDQSLDNILQMCIGATSLPSSRKKSLQALGLTSSNYPVSRIEALPHYQDFIDAGWTIGY